MANVFTAKLVAREVNYQKTSFTAYSLLSPHGNWYRVAGVDVKDLEPYADEIITCDLIRMYNKKVYDKETGEERLYPTLVIANIRKPSDKELQEYQTVVDKNDKATLIDVK